MPSPTGPPPFPWTADGVDGGTRQSLGDFVRDAMVPVVGRASAYTRRRTRRPAGAAAAHVCCFVRDVWGASVRIDCDGVASDGDDLCTVLVTNDRDVWYWLRKAPHRPSYGVRTHWYCAGSLDRGIRSPDPTSPPPDYACGTLADWRRILDAHPDWRTLFVSSGPARQRPTSDDRRSSIVERRASGDGEWVWVTPHPDRLGFRSR